MPSCDPLYSRDNYNVRPPCDVSTRTRGTISWWPVEPDRTAAGAPPASGAPAGPPRPGNARPSTLPAQASPRRTPRPRLAARPSTQALKEAEWDLPAARPLLPAASPRAAAAARVVAGCESLADLKAVVEARGHEFDAVALAAAAARVPKVMNGSVAGAERLLDRLMPRLLALVESDPGSENAAGGGEDGGATAGGRGLGPRELSNVLWAVSKAGYPLEASEVGRLLAALACNLGRAAPGELSMAAVAAARLAPGDDAFWAALGDAAAATLRAAAEEMAGGGGGGGGEAAAPKRPRRRRREQPELLHTGPAALAVAAAAARGGGGAEAGRVAQAAANLAWAHARAGRAHAGVVAALDAWLAAGGARALNPREISMLSWAAARWAHAAGAKPAGGEASSSSGSGGGGAALSDASISLVLDAAADKLWQFSGGELDGLVNAAARLGAQHPPLLAALAKQLDHPQAAAGAGASTLSAALWAAARAGSDGGRELLRAAAGALAGAPGAFAPRDAANVVWAAAAMGLADQVFYSVALERLAGCAGECSGRDLAHAMLGSCASRDAAPRARLLAAAAPAAAAAARAGGLAPRDAAAALRVLAAAAARGELEGHIPADELRAAAADVGASLAAQYRAGGVQAADAEDAAASLDALCGAGGAASAALRGGGAAAGGGEASGEAQ